MDYVIKALTPELATAFSDYLSGLDFSETPHWSSCFCRFYYTNCSNQEWINRTLETNRNEALEEITAGRMRGYLAYDGETCVGWCSANNVDHFPRIVEDLTEFCSGRRVGCTICYVIHPDYRGRGIARQLLNRAIHDFRADGFDAMIALPIESPGAEQRRYRGTLHMYQQAGYREIHTDGNLHVMWLELKNNE